MAALEFRTIEPKILYFGTPVALISSLNEDGATNLAPMSSFWALGWTLVLGVLDETKTAENLRDTPNALLIFLRQNCGRSKAGSAHGKEPGP